MLVKLKFKPGDLFKCYGGDLSTLGLILDVSKNQYSWIWIKNVYNKTSNNQRIYKVSHATGNSYGTWELVNES